MNSSIFTLCLFSLIPCIKNETTVESAYFEVIRIKKGLQIIRIQRARELKKNVHDRSEISYKCARGVDLNPFSLVALLQTLDCNVGGQTHTYTHTRITCCAEHSTTCNLFYKPGKVLSLYQNKKITPKNRFELTGSLLQNSN